MGECIKSILNQTFEAWQAIFIDDASTDGGTPIIEKIARKDCRVLLIRNKINCGVAQSREIGLSYVESPYIMFLDGDDMLTRNALSALWQGIKMWMCVLVNIISLKGKMQSKQNLGQFRGFIVN